MCTYTRQVRNKQEQYQKTIGNTSETPEQRTAQEEMLQQYRLISNTSERRVQKQASRERIKMSIQRDRIQFFDPEGRFYLWDNSDECSEQWEAPVGEQVSQGSHNSSG